MPPIARSRKFALAAAVAIGAVVGLAVPYIAQAPAKQPEASKEKLPPLPPNVVARVGATDINAEDVLARIYEIEKAKPSDPQHLSQSYTYLMNLAVVRQEAKRLGIVVTPDEREAEAQKQIAATKELLKKQHADAVTWEKYAESLGFVSVAAFEDVFRDRAEQILLKRRLVWLFEMTAKSAGFLQIQMKDRDDAVKVLAKLDAKASELKAREAAAKPAGATNPPAKDSAAKPDSPATPPAAPAKRTARWPAGTEYAQSAMGEEFFTTALFNSPRGTIEEEAFDGQPLLDTIRKVVFETLKVGEYSEVIEVGKDDYRIFYLKRKSPPSAETYDKLRKELDDLPDITARQFERWIQVQLATGRYPVRWRYPGQSEAEATPAKPADTSDPAKTGATGTAPAAPADQPAKSTGDAH
jgi:hypothetical protein